MNDLQAQGLKMYDEGERAIFGLSGKGSAKTRQNIMGMLKPSSRPHPIAKCGINALRAAAEELRAAEPQDDTAPYGVDEATGEPYEDEAAADEAARDDRNRTKQTGRS